MRYYLHPMGEPNTPLAFRQRDECHLKQQAGHEKTGAEIEQSTKDSISRIANYVSALRTQFPQKTG